jgi:hypothetical protein
MGFLWSRNFQRFVDFGLDWFLLERVCGFREFISK